MTVETHDLVQPLLGAFAVDALDEAQTGTVAAHLGSCLPCRRQVADFREVTGVLTIPVVAVGDLWQRLERALG